MKPGQMDRAYQKKQKYLSKGKEFRVYKETFMPDNNLVVDEELILFNEGYVLDYKQLAMIDIRNTGMIFDGYLTQYANIVAFDNNGEKKWDNTIRIENVKSRSLDNTLKIGFLDKNLILSYIKEDKIYHKLINKGTVLQEEQYQELKDLVSNIEMRNSNYNEYLHFYKNSFIIWNIVNEINGLTQVLRMERLDYNNQE